MLDARMGGDDVADSRQMPGNGHHGSQQQDRERYTGLLGPGRMGSVRHNWPLPSIHSRGGEFRGQPANNWPLEAYLPGPFTPWPPATSTSPVSSRQQASTMGTNNHPPPPPATMPHQSPGTGYTSGYGRGHTPERSGSYHPGSRSPQYFQHQAGPPDGTPNGPRNGLAHGTADVMAGETHPSLYDAVAARGEYHGGQAAGAPLSPAHPLAHPYPHPHPHAPPHPHHHPHHHPHPHPPAAAYPHSAVAAAAAAHPPPHPHAQSAPRQRTSIACKYCRRRKIRCSGYANAPGGKCTNCFKMNQECIFQPVSSGSSTAFVPVSALPNGVPPGVPIYGAYGQPLAESPNQSQAGPSNYQEAGPSNYQEAGPSNYQEAGPSNYQEAGPSNYQEAGPSNYQRAGPSNYHHAGPAGFQPQRESSAAVSSPTDSANSSTGRRGRRRLDQDHGGRRQLSAPFTDEGPRPALVSRPSEERRPRSRPRSRPHSRRHSRRHSRPHSGLYNEEIPRPGSRRSMSPARSYVSPQGYPTMPSQGYPVRNSPSLPAAANGNSGVSSVMHLDNIMSSAPVRDNSIDQNMLGRLSRLY
ncbi:hypothetical protein GGS20DRAFT_554608 [Poronia punctata]|nr:hypothetical protein GGS20DRAFT_554608 [Poronia punctata]